MVVVFIMAHIKNDTNLQDTLILLESIIWGYLDFSDIKELLLHSITLFPSNGKLSMDYAL